MDDNSRVPEVYCTVIRRTYAVQFRQTLSPWQRDTTVIVALYSICDVGKHFKTNGKQTGVNLALCNRGSIAVATVTTSCKPL
jgi:hypothetical protein